MFKLFSWAPVVYSAFIIRSSIIRSFSDSLHIVICRPVINATKVKSKIKMSLSVQGLRRSYPAHKTNPSKYKMQFKWNQSRCRQSHVSPRDPFATPRAVDSQTSIEFLSHHRSIDPTQASTTDPTLPILLILQVASPAHKKTFWSFISPKQILFAFLYCLFCCNHTRCITHLIKINLGKEKVFIQKWDLQSKK